MGYEVEYNGEITISPPLLGDIADPRKSIIPMLRKNEEGTGLSFTGNEKGYVTRMIKALKVRHWM